MQDNRRNVHRFLGLGVSRSAFFAILTATVGTMLVLSMLFSPSSSTTKVSAAQGSSNAALPQMLAYALNLNSATNYAVYGGHGLRIRGDRTRITGAAGSNGAISGGAGLASNDLNASSAHSDLSRALAAINQLPCSVVDSADLGGKAFGPGVYCLSSASLAGKMTLDAGGDANARFVFLVSGTFNAADGSSIELQNGAVAYNSYFIAADDISVGSGSDINSNLIATNDVSVGADSTVTGKTVGVNGDVSLTNANVVQQTGYIEVCKRLAEGETVIPAGTQFTFNVAGTNILVPAGGCSAPLPVAAGPVTVIEAPRANTAVVDIFTNPADRLVDRSLGLQRATVRVVEGGVDAQAIVTFVNQTTRTGYVEICKNANGADVRGTFSYTVEGRIGEIFTVPVGFCSGPITTTLLRFGNDDFTANVTELAQPTYRLEDITTLPTTSLNGVFLNQGFDEFGNPIPNVNGGYANVDLRTGGPMNETVVNFFNRSLPGQVKVCKITADPVGIPVGTRFLFEVRGTAPGAQTILPGTDVVRRVIVRAGPAEQGGFCEIVEGNFVVGTNVLVRELYNLDPLPPGINPNWIRVSSVTATTAFAPAPVTVQGITVNPNPDFTHPTNIGTEDQVLASAVAPQRNAFTEFTFTNFLFRPGILKVCKVAGGTIEVGTTFNFTFAPTNPAVTWPISAAPVAIQAGDAANGGACRFINGPFPAAEGFPGIGTFNAYNETGTPSNIVITEAATGGVTVQSIVSNTGCTVTPDLANRRATLNICQVAPGAVNVATVTNTNAAAPPAQAGARFDFDGDHRSDPVIFRPSTGTWWFASSANGGQFRAAQFGQAGDKVVAADYDGDGTSDYAVYRGDGNWYVLGSSRGLMSMNFGLATDIPQPGDWDGDNKADFAVYRPSNGVWYIMGSSVGFKAFQFGISTDSPEAADFDGDGTMDAAVYRSGVWYIMGSRDGFSAFQFGIASDKPVAADYDGDRKADAAVYRDGVWHILRSSAGYMAYQWGISTDTPVPADYDGDGRSDMAVYRGGANTWYITQSGSSAAGGYSQLSFGSTGDMLMNY